MLKIRKNILRSLITVVMFFGLPQFALAASSILRVDHPVAPNPIFDNISAFAPGQTINRYLEVTNISGTTQTVYLKTQNFTDLITRSRDPKDSTDNKNLSDLINLRITREVSSSTVVLFNGSLKQFSSLSPVPLSQITAGQTIRYDLEAHFDYSAKNSLQESSVNFDFVVGYDDGSGTVIPVGSSGGAAGGVIGGLQIIEPTVAIAVNNDNSAMFTWKTNEYSNSQVVFARISPNGEGFTFDPEGLNLGFPHATLIDESMLIDHSVLLKGLVPGATYAIRVVSRAGGKVSFSYQKTFIVPQSQKPNDTDQTNEQPDGTGGNTGGVTGSTDQTSGGTGGATEGAGTGGSSGTGSGSNTGSGQNGGTGTGSGTGSGSGEVGGDQTEKPPVNNNDQNNQGSSIDFLKYLKWLVALALAILGLRWLYIFIGSWRKVCIVCGYRGLHNKPFDDKNILETGEVCPSCGYEYKRHDGKTDGDINQQWELESVKRFRKQWFDKGSNWTSKDVKEPTKWSANRQLRNVPKDFK